MIERFQHKPGHISGGFFLFFLLSFGNHIEMVSFIASPMSRPVLVITTFNGTVPTSYLIVLCPHGVGGRPIPDNSKFRGWSGPPSTCAATESDLCGVR
jgi:hypothetical protein